MSKAKCYDCGIEYGSPGWIEAIIPDKAWDAIRPNGTRPGNGLLCINCISKRLAERGYSKVPVWLCGMEPLRVMAGSPEEQPNLFLLRHWDPEASGTSAKEPGFSGEGHEE